MNAIQCFPWSLCVFSLFQRLTCRTSSRRGVHTTPRPWWRPSRLETTEERPWRKLQTIFLSEEFCTSCCKRKICPYRMICCLVFGSAFPIWETIIFFIHPCLDISFRAPGRETWARCSIHSDPRLGETNREQRTDKETYFLFSVQRCSTILFVVHNLLFTSCATPVHSAPERLSNGIADVSSLFQDLERKHCLCCNLYDSS